MNNINTALQRERQKYKVRTFYLLGFIGCISIFVYFFLLLSNGTKIIILPEEASINAKVKSENFFDLSFNNFIYSFSSKPVFSVSSKGYKKIRETITHENKGKFHEVLMTELPGILNVNINNKNENTQWFLDEKFIFQGEKLEISLPAGQYNLAVNNPFFEKKNTNVINNSLSKRFSGGSKPFPWRTILAALFLFTAGTLMLVFGAKELRAPN